MLTCFIGHRGVGKTEFAKRLQIYLSDTEVEIFDLDLEIEKRKQRPIFELIMQEGESYFRSLEKQVFAEILQTAGSQRTYLVLGAGFPVQEIAPEIQVVWIRRVTDVDGRIFLDRPRLDPESRPLAEYQMRLGQREIHYANRADFVYWLPEGNFDRSLRAKQIEQKIWKGPADKLAASVTLTRTWFQSPLSWASWLSHIEGRYRFIELRDDLLSEAQMQKAIDNLPLEDFLYSFRNTSVQSVNSSSIKALDWALELGEPPESFLEKNWQIKIISWHGEFREGVEKLAAFQHKGVHLKLASYIGNFEELWLGLQWQARDPEKRSFLPMSLNQRWGWVRLYLKERQLLNFIKEGDGSAGDQPTLFQYLAAPKAQLGFAAVLGQPVYHSWSPIEHLDFFFKQEIPFYAITLAEEEWDQAFPYLEKIGLKYAAVTSPCKDKAKELIKGFEAMNTLYNKSSNVDSAKWLGLSTDTEGFQALLEGAAALISISERIAVWGGGGVLQSLQKALPKAHYFQSRNGLDRTSQAKAEDFSPEAVVWAAPRRADSELWPPESWQPKVILDLNYKEDSLGREYAQRCGCLYVSGQEMFQRQAELQRVFWKKQGGS